MKLPTSRQNGLLDGVAMDRLAARPDAAGAGELSPGAHVGIYSVIALVGRGGMGEVYKAERIGVDFRQIVALKLMRTDAVCSTERFQAERQILAIIRMAHTLKLRCRRRRSKRC